LKIHKLRDELGAALQKEKWKTTRNRARKISKLIPLAMSPDTCGTGERRNLPHLDGVCTVGYQHFISAPSETKEALENMNKAIREAQSKLGKKKKKKKR